VFLWKEKNDLLKQLLSLYRFLENEIHKTNLKLMEGDTIKKKYVSILDMLKQERLGFANQLENLEANFLITKRRHLKSSLKKETLTLFLLSVSVVCNLVVLV
jgi:hypothetical protein